MTVKNAAVQDAPVWRLVEGRGTEAIAVRFRDGSVIFGALYRKVRFFCPADLQALAIWPSFYILL